MESSHFVSIQILLYASFRNLCLRPKTYLFSYHGLSRDSRSIRARLRFQPRLRGIYIYIYILVLRFEFYRFQYSQDILWENKYTWDVKDGVFKSIPDSLLLWYIVTCRPSSKFFLGKLESDFRRFSFDFEKGICFNGIFESFIFSWGVIDICSIHKIIIFVYGNLWNNINDR